MWPLGVLVTVLVAMAISYRLSLFKPAPQIATSWDLPRNAGTYTTISGTLAGFSVTAAIFLANLRVVRDAQEFEGVMAMFLFAFVAFIGAAMQFASMPNAATDDPYSLTVQRYAYILANLAFYHGIAQSWLGLRLLLLGIGFDHLADIFIGVLLFVTIAEAFRIARLNLHLTTLSPLACLAIPLAGLTCAGGYYGLTALMGAPWPDNAPLGMAVVCFVSTAFGHVLQNGLLMGSGHVFPDGFLHRACQKVVLLYSQAAVTCVFLLWFAMASA